MDVWRKIAEERIRQAEEKGDFNELPGRGEPLDLDDPCRLPEDLRLAYKVLKNAGYTPPELDAQKEIAQIEDMLAGDLDEKARYQAIKRLNFLTTKLGELRPRSALWDDRAYSEKLVDRLAKPPRK